MNAHLFMLDLIYKEANTSSLSRLSAEPIEIKSKGKLSLVDLGIVPGGER